MDKKIGRPGEDQVSAICADILARRTSLKKAWGILGLTPRVFLLAWRVTPGPIVLLMILRVVTSLVPVAQLWLGKMVIDGILAALAPSPAPGAPSLVFAVVGGLGLLTLLQNALIQVQSYVQDYMGRRLSLHSDFLLREKMFDLDLATVEDPAFYDRYVRAAAGAGAKPLTLVSEAMNVVGNIVTLVSLGGVFVALQWPMTVILVITAIPHIHVLLKYSQKSYDIQLARTHDSRWASYHASLLSMPQSFKEVRILGIGRHLLDRYQQFKWREFREDRLLLKGRQIEGFVATAVGVLAYYGAYLFIAYQALRKNITIGDISFYAGGFMSCQNAIRSLVSVVPNAHDINVYVKDFFDLQNAEPELVKPVGREPVARPVHTIEFRGVSFRYPRTDKWVLKDVNLTFRQGEKIGLLGENGAGKTSLVKLLCRLYDPTEGAIYVDGVDLRDIEIGKWHAAIAVIFQDFVVYANRIRDNIGYGQVDQLNNLPRIVDAATKGQADDFICKLPEGYETLLGREFKKGEWLSGGQQQRLALARLFMRAADVLILDEPTFALDPRSEYEVYETCKRHCDGKISLLISHRFATMRITSRVIVLEGGRVAEDGTHEDLVRSGGRYAELYEVQSRSLRR